ncbi:FAD-dependent oxidoreductase [Burkholderia sp. BCC0044]|uniref:NAD(P)/FAD-dependent oxidoreductase n=1 Tax=Burkholderia sp. BCC0044 TaxID=2676295 RepID=UPI00158CDB87|nr:FAD-dependent oxidoreductase [Burkholderia sp. BCC0044]
MNSSAPVIIVGAGHAGGRAALALRELGYRGAILLIGEETQLPYERPPLSKQILLGSQTPVHCALGSAERYQSDGIQLRTGARVERIDRASRSVMLSNGEVLPYSQLLLATGGRVRALALPGAMLDGVHYLRTLDDALALKARLRPGTRMVVIGGGFIGLEVAASARQLGAHVTMLEAGDRLAARALPPQLAERVRQLHCSRGVDVRLQCRIRAFSGTSSVTAVELEGGDSLSCDLIAIGVGIVPNVELAAAAGMEVGNGIRVDSRLRTSDPNIYAIGDVCEFPNPFTGQPVRMETWRNAEEQAHHVARILNGEDVPFTALPWFWSDQFDYSLQLAGEPQVASRMVERKATDDSLLLFYLNEHRQLVGVCGWGAGNSIAKDIKLAERLIASGNPLIPEVLATPSVSLKSLIQDASYA